MTSIPSVLVTGASTGIGRAVVEDLAARDVQVIAGVRDVSSVPEHPNVVPLRLDVTDEHDLADAAGTVAEVVGGRGLRGLVNNAGIAVGGPLEFVDLDEVRRQLEVNVVGALATTQTFLPLLRHCSEPARVVFTGSIGGRVASPMVGPYAASKHALRGMAESLRHELRPWGIGVSVLAPATVATPIWQKAQHDVERIVESLPPRAHELYAGPIGAMRSILAGAGGGMEPAAVARVARRALFARRPRPEYLIGTEARVMAVSTTLLPRRVVDAAVDRRLRGA